MKDNLSYSYFFNYSDTNIAGHLVSLSIFTGLLSTNPSMIFNTFVSYVSVSVNFGTTGISHSIPLCCCFFEEYSILLACLVFSLFQLRVLSNLPYRNK